ncbi:phytoene desaturase family protein [Evansella cellulosilytica]|uniref:FAD-dependent pyridine nucleotide-disulfide oxidoreductase n=1 Tax=Evansella cellulosilytica (strain ATCC 21833 / DSM 2522 / FERM P-1141 / JCM 9156 / N-4) TaxID=649639 RepID=E6TSM8_EVAC2|nr:FAD-dependent oxidoreductase [Evansella cellulosilytica]ADU29536.1 FAD-dependent pyridine nucleotide-disulfide oxidoreductase [Evansella cellulosilytica DSM 2522]
MIKKWDVVIVGGGLAGYVAANYLGRKGVSVLLLEKSSQVGGRARTVKIKQNFFNIGPHAFYSKGQGREILEELKVKLVGKSPSRRCTLVNNDQFYDAPFSPISILNTKLLNWHERFEWINCLLKINRDIPIELEKINFQQWVEQTASSESVRSLLYTLGRLATYCHAPSDTAAKVIVAQMKLAMKGTLYLDGGWQTIIDQLHQQAVLLGVQIQTTATVTEINFRGMQAGFHILLADGKEIQGENMIYTAEPNKLNTLLKQAPTKKNTFYDRVMPVTAATLDVALTNLPHPKQIFSMGIEDALYFSVHSASARLSDQGNHIIHVLKYLSPDVNINSKEIKSELESFLDKIQPGWQEYKVNSRFLPQLIVNQRLPKIGDEKKLESTGIPGLFLAGDWASADWILSEGAIRSGKRAAMEIVQRKGRR